MFILGKLKFRGLILQRKWGMLCVRSYLKRGGSMGSFCISTIRMTLCFAPELNATPCCDGVYLRKKKA